jgi:hypothetical protein
MMMPPPAPKAAVSNQIPEQALNLYTFQIQSVSDNISLIAHADS